jgi:hypothetical protein
MASIYYSFFQSVAKNNSTAGETLQLFRLIFIFCVYIEGIYLDRGYIRQANFFIRVESKLY